MDKYLIALDLDGTLLYDFDSLDESFCSFMRDLQKAGHKIVIATGRPYRSSRFVYERFGLDTPIINYNGGLITHPKDPSFPIINFTVRKEWIVDIFDHNVDYIRNAFSEVRDTIYLYREEAAIEPLLHRTPDSEVHIGPLHDILKQDPNGFIIIGKQGTGTFIENYINEKYRGSVLARVWHLSGEYDSIVEVFTPESNKGKGLAHVAEWLGFPRERVIAIGDGHNDLEMLAYAGLGVAMKGSHPDLLKIADRILPDGAREGAVGTFLREFLDLK